VSSAPVWTFIIPFYDEEAFLGATLDSLIAQTLRPFRLILIDNASTDRSAAIAHQKMAKVAGIETVHLFEPRPGKIHALEQAMEHLATPFVALGDADTLYPPHYLATADHVLRTGGERVVAAMAMDVYGDPEGRAARLRRFAYPRIVTRLLSRQCHTGGYAQCFRADALRRAGGFSEAQWPYVLLDHEIMQRVFKQGEARYHPDLWCQPSPRRADRRNVRWTLFERLLYHATPFALKDWYFYRFLGPRLAARKLRHVNLREKSWEPHDG
jgi:glycosyltransferase involved in cell wall biosynthesis